MKIFNIVAIWGMSCFLLACSSETVSEPVCPQVAVIRALSRADLGTEQISMANKSNNKRDNAGKSNKSKGNEEIISATISRGEGRCEAVKGELHVNFELVMEAKRSNTATAREFTMPYIVAVADPNENVRSRSDFVAKFVFNEGDDVVLLKEPIRVKIPSPNKEAVNWRVLSGYRLPIDEINRR